ncbi:helix-turn-helix domain-containing protein [Bacillus carboniphilus]|uniref:Helix-turn-helix domain-containing protein n=1 Tax=Bacillus carboniphilus TaxID=86663 RepID=A0ABN0W8V4_9BACI
MKKSESKLDLLLHPVRMRIVQCLAGGKQRTPQEMSSILNDVPPATLYRHINKLAHAELLDVVEERPIRGTVERVYTLSAENSHVHPEELANLSKEDHVKYFTGFLTHLMMDFEQYLQRDHVDFIQDGVGYRQILINLSDEELIEFGQKMNEFLQSKINNQPGEGRTLRKISSIIIPSDDPSSE